MEMFSYLNKHSTDFYLTSEINTVQFSIIMFVFVYFLKGNELDKILFFPLLYGQILDTLNFITILVMSQV